MIKKHYRIARIFCFLVFTAISSAAADTVPAPGKLSIVTSFYPLHIMALNVVKDTPDVAEAVLTAPATGCLHDYALTTADMKKLSTAGILIANGAGMEPFLDRITRQYPKLRIVRLTDNIPLLKDRYNSTENPHTWMSFDLNKQEVAVLARTLSSMDPAHAQQYTQNADAYIKKLEDLRLRFYRELSPYKGKRIITFHAAFPYFSHEFGLTVAAVIEQDPGSEPNAKELARIIDLIEHEKVSGLFIEPQYPSHAAEIISKETNTPLYTLDPAVTGPNDPDAFLKIMEENLKVLKNAL
jgi:zinc transport system substrate-binding protein